MARYEDMKLSLACITDEIIEQYNLRTLSSNGGVFLEIQKFMPGLKKSGRIANDRLKAHLAQFGFAPVPITPALWKHDTKPIFFSLIVDDFGVKFIGNENANYLIQALHKSTPYPSTGLVPSSAYSPSTGTLPYTPVTSPCQCIYKQPCYNSNIHRQNAPNTPHTPGKNAPIARKSSTHKKTTLLLSCLQKQSTSCNRL